MRSPRPAARIMAFIVESEGVADALFLRLELLEQAPERGKLAIRLQVRRSSSSRAAVFR